MPKGTKVHRLAERLKDKYPIGSAIAIAQSQTHQSYKTGKMLSKTKAKR